MIIDKEIYKGIEIEIHYFKEDKTFSAVSSIASSFKPFDPELKNFGGGFATPQEAVHDVKARIDKIFKDAPRTYDELATILTDHCNANEYIGPDVLEPLVEAFLKARGE